MNKATLKSNATLLGKAFQVRGVTLPRSEQLDLAAQLEGARHWHHAVGVLEKPSTSGSRPFDVLQLEAAQGYCQGDFSHVTNFNELDHLGDTLFGFVIKELSDADGDREEAARMLRQAAEQLENLAEYLDQGPHTPYVNNTLESQVLLSLTPALMGYDATTPQGDNANWNLHFVTDRFGDSEKAASQHLASWVGDHPERLEQMRSVCLDEIGFIVELNGKIGVLYEVEIITTESEGLDRDGITRCTVPEAIRRSQLTSDIYELQRKHPEVQWAVGGPFGISDNRLAVWAFCPETTLFTVDQAKQLTESLYRKFY